jgi:hypothetical protein
MRRAVAVLAFAVALIGVFAPAAAADTPAFPPVSTYEGCTDWQLQRWSPMSPDNPQWTIVCEMTGDEYGITWWRWDEYYWNKDAGEIWLFATSYYDDGGWYSSCILYPSGVGACDA